MADRIRIYAHVPEIPPTCWIGWALDKLQVMHPDALSWTLVWRGKPFAGRVNGC